MSAVLALTDTLTLAFVHSNDFIIAAGSEKLVTAIRNFIGPIFLLAIGIAAMSFLFQRQVTQFLQFAALAVGIAIFFYTPGVVPTVAQFFSSAF